jgi:hypothetical protein
MELADIVVFIIGIIILIAGLEHDSATGAALGGTIMITTLVAFIWMLVWWPPRTFEEKLVTNSYNGITFDKPVTVVINRLVYDWRMRVDRAQVSVITGCKE